MSHTVAGSGKQRSEADILADIGFLREYLEEWDALIEEFGSRDQLLSQIRTLESRLGGKS